ncbi:MAG TPA: TIGR01777 family oxidoreductase [Candidatus Acidoferrales bacterium]|jgi:hypothetical protein|nr:TIGR01777 family oxidoreductase [Candidatus Acidoferrales bacterium]
MKVAVSGSSGLVGSALTTALVANGHTVARFVRPESPATSNSIRWDPLAGTLDAQALEGADAIVHLAGASIAGGRWTAARKKILRSSRVEATQHLLEGISKLRRRPAVFISASAIGFYGDRGVERLTESSAPGDDFLSQLARDWEASASRAESLGMRTVLLRFGVILSTRGGALPRMLTPFRLGAGGRLGPGKQWMSWLTLDEVIAIILYALEKDSLRGPVNAVAPNPATNAEFTRVLARALHRPALFPAPAFALRLVLGEMADALLLSSQRVFPERLTASGYAFRHPLLAEAIATVLASEK